MNNGIMFLSSIISYRVKHFSLNVIALKFFTRQFLEFIITILISEYGNLSKKKRKKENDTRTNNCSYSLHIHERLMDHVK